VYEAVEWFTKEEFIQVMTAKLSLD